MAEVLHASAVAIDGRACLITGPSGSGKSTLAIEMIALGAVLVSDDRTEVRRDGQRLLLSPPRTIAGLVEARGVGLLRVPHVAEAEASVIVDLEHEAADRLPDPLHRTLLGLDCPVILGRNRVGLAAILSLVLRHGPVAPV